MKYGIKLWSDNDPSLFAQAKDLIDTHVFDFLELYVVPGTLSSFFEEYKSLPISLHATHESHGLNLSKNNDENTAILEEVEKFRQYFASEVVVVHPGVQGTFEVFLQNLQHISKKYYYVENMPHRNIPRLGGGYCVGSTFDEMQTVQSLGYNLCIDFGHAVAASVSHGIPYKKYIEQLLTLSPHYFHVSDGDSTVEYDSHLDIGTGTIDFKYIKELIRTIDDAKVVFETPKVGKTLENDIKNLNYFSSL